MNYKLLILSSTIALFLSSAVPSERHSLKIGEPIPRISLLSNSKLHSRTINPENAIINFWSVKDASSRVANLYLSKLAERGESNKRIISICLDNDRILASEIMTVDAISSKILSLNASEVSDDMLSDFQTSAGCRCFITDNFGNLEACILPQNIRGIYKY